MALSLPADAEPFIPDGEPWDHLHEPAVYALTIDLPDDLEAAWDATHDTRPAYWDDLVDADGVVYIGEAGDVLHRLEQHRDGEQTGVLMEAFGIDSLRNIWFMPSKEKAEQEESRLAIMLQNERLELYVHSR
jgi:predicted GIY-YIG superfamily endonuclease